MCSFKKDFLKQVDKLRHLCHGMITLPAFV